MPVEISKSRGKKSGFIPGNKIACLLSNEIAGLFWKKILLKGKSWKTWERKKIQASSSHDATMIYIFPSIDGSGQNDPGGPAHPLLHLLI
jgi:hypothetical protein